MKKLILVLISLMFIGEGLYAVRQPAFKTGPSGYRVTIFNDGDVDIPGGAYITGNISSSGTILSEVGILQYRQDLIDVPTASSGCIITISVATNTLTGGGTTWTDFDQGSPAALKYPVNLTASFEVSYSTHWIYGNVTIIGVDAKGNVATEVILATRTTVTAGVIAYSQITSIKVQITAARGCFGEGTPGTTNTKIDIGIGTVFGLCNNIKETTDVYKVQEAGSNVNPTLETISTTYDTIDFVTNPNGSYDYTIWYKARSR